MDGVSAGPLRFTTEPSFEEASRAVLAYLDEHVPLDFWTVSRVVDGRQVYLQVTENDLGLGVGDGPAWESSFCQAMWDEAAPQVVPDVSAVPVYREREAALDLTVGSYVGIPLVGPDGALFGTVCGIGTRAAPAGFEGHAPLLELLGWLLTSVLRAEQQAVALARQLETSRLHAETDALTGLLNRRAWREVCLAEEDRHRRLGDHLGVMVVDLDGLKALNDREGHAAGDELLLLAATVLRQTSRGGDHVARLGGDEFAVLCPRTTASQLAAKAERFTGACAAVGLAASVGVATMEVGGTLAGTEAAADRAMYEAKRRRHASPPPPPSRRRTGGSARW
jgi:diguanylate cyclase